MKCVFLLQKPEKPALSITEKKAEQRRPSKPLAPEFIYMGEHKDDLKKRFPAADDRKITRMLMSLYNGLSDEEKVGLFLCG